MKIVDVHKSREKIHAVVIFFSLFVALMLFQTSYMRLGTLTAAGAIFLTIIAFFFQNGTLNTKIRFSPESIVLCVFLVYILISALLRGTAGSNLTRFASQIVLCIILFSFTMNERECEYLKKVFVFASVVYAILIIDSLRKNVYDGQVHAHVLIFNTEFDPNYIGIPLVAATVLLLDNILNKRKIAISAVSYAIILGAIIYTASRGSFVSLAASNMLLLGWFLFKKNKRLSQRIFSFLLSIVVVLVLMKVFKELFPQEWRRLVEEDMGDGSGRLKLWKRAFEDWLERPFLGHGLGYALRTYNYVTHNTYLQVLSELGIVGFFIIFSVIASLAKKAFSVDLTVFCMLIGTLVQITFLDAIDNRCLWILLCWIAMLPEKQSKWLEK